MVHVRSYAMRLKVEGEEGLERESRRGEAADGKGSSITVDCAQSAPRSRGSRCVIIRGVLQGTYRKRPLTASTSGR